MKLWARVFIGYFLIVGLSGWFGSTCWRIAMR